MHACICMHMPARTYAVHAVPTYNIYLYLIRMMDERTAIIVRTVKPAALNECPCACAKKPTARIYTILDYKYSCAHSRQFASRAQVRVCKYENDRLHTIPRTQTLASIFCLIHHRVQVCIQSGAASQRGENLRAKE